MVTIPNMALFQRNGILENPGCFLENYGFLLGRLRV